MTDRLPHTEKRGSRVSRAQRWWRQDRPHRPWARAYFATFCALEVIATIFAAEDGYWTFWFTAPAVLMFAIAAVLS